MRERVNPVIRLIRLRKKYAKHPKKLALLKALEAKGLSPREIVARLTKEVRNGSPIRIGT